MSESCFHCVQGLDLVSCVNEDELPLKNVSSRAVSIPIENHRMETVLRLFVAG